MFTADGMCLVLGEAEAGHSFFSGPKLGGVVQINLSTVKLPSVT